MVNVCIHLYISVYICVCGQHLVDVTRVYTSEGDVAFTLDILKELTSKMSLESSLVSHVS